MIDEKIRIMHILPHVAAGGATLAALELATGFDPARYEVSMAVGPQFGGENSVLHEIHARGIETHMLPHMSREPDLRRDMRALIELTGAIQRCRPHVVHTHGSKPKLLTAVAAAIGSVPVRIAHLWGWEWMPVEGRVQRCACRWASRLSALGYDAMIACSEAMQEQGLTRGIGRTEQYEVAFPGVDAVRFSPDGRGLARRNVRAEFGLPMDAPLAISVMRLAPQKAPEVLLRAASLLADSIPRLHWLIVGGGPLEHEVCETVAALGLRERVTLAGPRWDIAQLMKASDLFALASRWEPFGIVYLEAAATGLPVVGTAVDGAVEAVNHGTTGLLVPPERPNELAEAVMRVATDGVLAQRLGDAGVRHARHFSHERFFGSVGAVYQRLLANKLGWQFDRQETSLPQAAS
ncbi:MAG: glycosyltransferase [Armatimonadota bacterium]